MSTLNETLNEKLEAAEERFDTELAAEVEAATGEKPLIPGPQLRGGLTRKLEANAGKVRFRRWKNMTIPARISLIVILIIVLIAIFANFLAPYSPYETSFKPLQPPSIEHPFGTDAKMRDVLSRVMFGARFSLVIGLGATAFALVIGSIIGSIAAVSRKWVSEVIMRILDIIMSFPGIALATTLIIAFGEASVQTLILAIGCLYIPQIARIVRANVVSEYGQDYVRAVVVSGARAPWILWKHVMRNCLAPVLVFTIVLVADAIVFEASLSFLGVGLESYNPTWGNILADARQVVIAGKWWQAFFPGLLIVITVLCLNILSEGITDAMAAPKAAIKPSDSDLNTDREADRLVADPALAYAAQAEMLSNRLAQLKAMEEIRTDRFEATTDAEPVLEVKNLCIKFPRHGDVNVVDNVSFVVRPRQTMGLVGESGCGKSITSLAIMGLLDKRAKISGEILYNGKNLLDLSEKEMNALRGHEISMVYQDALSSLNPSMLIKAQMKQLTKRGGTRTAEELLELVGLDPARTLDSYPHELSGGQRQRVLIAMALTRDPKLIIADEPTTALDVTVQKQVIDLLNKLQKELGFAMVFVSHDLALVAEVANSLTVMYAGQVVEQGPVKDVLTNPVHEYTRGLLGSVLSIEAGGDRLHQIPGSVPSPADFPQGDRFTPRSSHADKVSDVRPVLKRVGNTDHYYAELPDDELKRLGIKRYITGGDN